jgi:hypothetical protein
MAKKFAPAPSAPAFQKAPAAPRPPMPGAIPSAPAPKKANVPKPKGGKKC